MQVGSNLLGGSIGLCKSDLGLGKLSSIKLLWSCKNKLRASLAKRIRTKYWCRLRLIAVTTTLEQFRFKERGRPGLLSGSTAEGICLVSGRKRKRWLKRRLLLHWRKQRRTRNANKNTVMEPVLKRNLLRNPNQNRQLHL